MTERGSSFDHGTNTPIKLSGSLTQLIGDLIG
jgi:hypothetical protein